MIIAAPRTGVIIANIRNANNVPIVEKGNKTLRFLIPGIANVRRVTSKLVNETVVLTPAKITLIIKISCAPIPVYFVQEEKGVMNVHPAVTNALFEHLVK
jgi:citrate lyase synthetase